MSNIAIIVAAGTGSRCNSILPKQYEKLQGKAILSMVIEKFLSLDLFSDIVIVVNHAHKELYQPIISQYKLTHIVNGGKTRNESVFKALLYLEKNLNPKNILIHDAARAFISSKLISNILALLDNHKAVMPAISIHDTVKKISNLNNNSDKYNITHIERDELYRIQTPQGFAYHKLLEIYKKNYHNNDFTNHYFTDDASLLEDSNINVKICAGEAINFKITTENDLKMAKIITQNKITKTGIGFDVHSFAPKTSDSFIILGGVKIPAQHEIIAHSDGDILIHAVVDALLGALGKGDIGEYFPPEDKQYKNMASTVFLEHSRKLIVAENAQITNIDCNIICETPKILPHKAKIRDNLAKLLQLDITQINIKATTTEKLGFIGRKEGIAVQAVANILI